jgi:hypothetical protein
MKRSLLVVFALAGTLTAGAVQAKEVPAQVPAPAVAHAAQHQTLQSYANWNGVPAYLMRKDGTLINGLQPTNPDAQG